MQKIKSWKLFKSEFYHEKASGNQLRKRDDLKISSHVQVGMLRVVISLEDLGAALPPWQTSAPAPSPAPQPFRYPTAPPHPQHDLQGYQGEGAGEQGTGQGAGQGQGERGQPGPGAGAQGVLNVPQVQQLPEYEAAYHLEVWKKGAGGWGGVEVLQFVHWKLRRKEH